MLLTAPAGPCSLALTSQPNWATSSATDRVVLFPRTSSFRHARDLLPRPHGRGHRPPSRTRADFLIHDSHLFDGVGDPQIASALTVAAEAAEEEGMHYIVSLNSDYPSEAAQGGFSVEDCITDLRLTDASEEGGLFGFRF
ncbi:DUF2326 domain-containing protein [Streptomyces sp. CA-142005]|uniref:DUF2326 domain-containing protein n=1 Tax=Streptomyces sp. CA-142005 TaxID=3240052 RepID=UPI003D94B91D